MTKANERKSLENKLAFWTEQRNEAIRKIREIETLLGGGQPRKHSTIKATCPHCGVEVRVRKDGKPFAHPHPDDIDYMNCPGGLKRVDGN